MYQEYFTFLIYFLCYRVDYLYFVNLFDCWHQSQTEDEMLLVAEMMTILFSNIAGRGDAAFLFIIIAIIYVKLLYYSHSHCFVYLFYDRCDFHWG